MNGNLRELDRLAAQTARFCQENALAGEVEFDLNLALEELFVNAVRHGGCEGMANAVEVRLQLLDGGVRVDFSDSGQAFDPADVPAPDLTAPLEERRAGGLGLHFVRQLMKDLQYQREDGRNRMTMRLKTI